MKTLELFTPEDQGYGEVCAFAHKVYREDLAFHLVRFPEILFAIHERGSVVGCLGLNRELRFGLFRNDPRLHAIIDEAPYGTVFGEQSILALRHCSMGLPLLISVAAAYGNQIGMDRIAYAAIPVSQKTIATLGMKTITYGPADLSVFPERERNLYATWRALNPVCCILDTETAPRVCDRVLERFARKVVLGQRLEAILRPQESPVSVW